MPLLIAKPIINFSPDMYQGRLKLNISLYNVLKKLIDSELKIRERKGNYWFIRLTNKEFGIVKKELNRNQLKSSVSVYWK